MRKRIWTQEKLNEAKKLLETLSASKAAVVMGVKSKNCILGALFREKIKNGYEPPIDSPWAVTKNHRRDFEKIERYYDKHKRSW